MSTKTAQRVTKLIKVVKFMIAKAYEAIMHNDFELIITTSFTKLRAFDMDIHVSLTYCHIIAGPLEIYHDDKKTRLGIFYHKPNDGNIDIQYIDVPELRGLMTKFHELVIKKIRDILEKTLKEYQ